MAKANIKVYKAPLSLEVIKEFTDTTDLLIYNGGVGNTLHADQIEINGNILLGWDELYMFI